MFLTTDVMVMTLLEISRGIHSTTDN